ncbi:MAG: dihydrofolate reductase [bacterium]|nr:dihydrofolate reductase [bacterium]
MNQKRKLPLKIKISFTAYVASSIDGRIAKSGDSGTDWTSKEDWFFFQKSLKKFDAVVVGHNTFRITKAQLKKRNTIVFTSKINKPKFCGSVIFFNPKKSNFKKFIKSQNYKKVAVLGGPKVYNYFLENKILDELFVTIEPVVFTTGVPMFSGKLFRKYKFSLVSTKKLNKNGTLLLKYKYGN